MNSQWNSLLLLLLLDPEQPLEILANGEEADDVKGGLEQVEAEGAVVVVAAAAIAIAIAVVAIVAVVEQMHVVAAARQIPPLLAAVALGAPCPPFRVPPFHALPFRARPSARLLGMFRHWAKG